MSTYLALCFDCKPLLPMPFSEKADRDEWVTLHTETGHNVTIPTPPFDTGEIEG